MSIEEWEEALRQYALTFPEAVEEFPWGERAFKVKKKVFLFLSAHPDHVTFSVKLPESGEFVLNLPYTEPTGYGLGKHGWVTGHLKPDTDAPLDLLHEWIEESYRAVAPKKLARLVRGEG
jgi:predicted DNA-binding protein (MmcQ/YjbR family)